MTVKPIWEDHIFYYARNGRGLETLGHSSGELSKIDEEYFKRLKSQGYETWGQKNIQIVEFYL